MSGRREEDQAALAWPGFVDILSAVVIMFVFFLMIVAVSLYFHTIIYKSKVFHQSEVQIKSSVEQQEDLDLKKEIKRLEEENKILQEQVISEQQNNTKDLEGGDIAENKGFLDASLNEAKEQASDISPNKLSITVYFDKNSVTLSKITQQELSKFLDIHKTELADNKYNIYIEVGKASNAPTETVARKIAISRLFNARNDVLKYELLSRDIIIANIVAPKKIKGTYHWATITLKLKNGKLGDK